MMVRQSISGWTGGKSYTRRERVGEGDDDGDGDDGDGDDETVDQWVGGLVRRKSVKGKGGKRKEEEGEGQR